MTHDQKVIDLLIRTMRATHPYYCVKGGHFGIAADDTQFCWAGCNHARGYWFSNQ